MHWRVRDEPAAAIDDAPDRLVRDVLDLDAERGGMTRNSEAIAAADVDDCLRRIVRAIIQSHGHLSLLDYLDIERAARFTGT